MFPFRTCHDPWGSVHTCLKLQCSLVCAAAAPSASISTHTGIRLLPQECGPAFGQAAGLIMQASTVKPEVAKGSGTDKHHNHHQEHEENWFELKREEMQILLASPIFDTGIGAVIALNAITIGIEQSIRVQGHDTRGIKLAENVFLLVYIVELGLRFFAAGLNAVKADRWVRFDLFLVILGVTTDWILEPALKDSSPDQLGPLIVLRTGRLLRLAKSGRLLMKFREFWMLIRGLLSSAGIMLYTIFTLIIIIYVFSSMAIELITFHHLAVGNQADPSFVQHVDDYFATLPDTMLTLLRFVTLDDMHSIYRPLIEQDGTLAIYFICLILVVSIVFVNLITAVVISSTFEQNVQDKADFQSMEELKLKKVVREMRRVFHRIDEEGTGRIARGDVTQVSAVDRALLCQALAINDAVEVFDAMDFDGSGSVAIDDFCNIVTEVVASKAPLEVKRTEKQIRAIYTSVKESQAFNSGMQELLEDVRRELAIMKERVHNFQDAIEPLWPTGGTLTRSAELGTGAIGLASLCEEKPRESVKSPSGLRISVDKGSRKNQVEPLICLDSCNPVSPKTIQGNASSRRLSSPSGDSAPSSCGSPKPGSANLRVSQGHPQPGPSPKSAGGRSSSWNRQGADKSAGEELSQANKSRRSARLQLQSPDSKDVRNRDTESPILSPKEFKQSQEGRSQPLESVQKAYQTL